MTFERVARLRVKSVTMKATGKKLMIFNNDGPRDVLDCLIDSTNIMLEKRKDDAVGYVMICWGRDGGVTSDLRIRDGRYVGRSEVANFVKDVVDNHIFGYDTVMAPEGE